MSHIPAIRPVTDLRTKFTDISKTVHETNEPMILTKNGVADLIVMSVETYENELFRSEVYLKLKESEIEARNSPKYCSQDELIAEMQAKYDLGDIDV